MLCESKGVGGGMSITKYILGKFYRPGTQGNQIILHFLKKSVSSPVYKNNKKVYSETYLRRVAIIVYVAYGQSFLDRAPVVKGNQNLRVKIDGVHFDV